MGADDWPRWLRKYFEILDCLLPCKTSAQYHPPLISSFSILSWGKSSEFAVYTAFHKNVANGISGCRKNRLNIGTFF
jgi:hypothetical protein